MRVPTITAINRLTRTQKYAATGSSVAAVAALAIVGTPGSAGTAVAEPAAWTADAAGTGLLPGTIARQADTAHRLADVERSRQQAANRDQHRAAAPARPSGTPRQIAQQMIGDSAQLRCFSNIVSHESGWDPSATNPSSGSYGLVQALPASKMSSAGADWQTNPATQIKWGLDYMNGRYGSPCAAWSFWQSHSWY